MLRLIMSYNSLNIKAARFACCKNKINDYKNIFIINNDDKNTSIIKINFKFNFDVKNTSNIKINFKFNFC